MRGGSCLRVFLGVVLPIPEPLPFSSRIMEPRKGKPGQEGTRPGRVGGKYARIDIVTDFQILPFLMRGNITKKSPRIPSKSGKHFFHPKKNPPERV